MTTQSNTGCVATYTAAGTVAGGVVGNVSGGAIGGVIGGAGGAAGGALVGSAVPGFGTVVGAGAGGAAGTTTGAAVGSGLGTAVGALAGARLGYLVGNIVCAKGGDQNIIPSWAEGQRPLPGESGKDFAKRLCDARYGPGNYPTGRELIHKKSSRSSTRENFGDSVYVLWHVHDVDGTDDEKLVGIYRSKEDAKAAIQRLKNKPGFRETQDGFSIDKYSLNRDSWQEGFVRVAGGAP